MESITSDDILGKTAIDPQGALLGVVVKLHIDNRDKQLQGITVDQGFLKPDLYVGIEHVKHFGVDAIFLSAVPYHQLKGKKVFSAYGAYLGNVVRVDAEGSQLHGLVLNKRAKGFKKEEHVVSAGEIKETGESIILRKRAEEPLP